MFVEHENPDGPQVSQIALVRQGSQTATLQQVPLDPQSTLARQESVKGTGISTTLYRTSSGKNVARPFGGSPSMLKRTTSAKLPAITQEPPSTLVRNLSRTLSRSFSNKVHPGVPLKFGITQEEIKKLEGSFEELKKRGGVRVVMHALRITADRGVEGEPEEIKKRTESFGSNTYPEKKRKRFWQYVWEALQDETLLILIACAIVSLVVGLTTEDPKSGWYDGAGIAFAVICVVLVASISDWRQSLQFLELTAEKRKIYINCTRGGRRCKVLIFDLVVGDIVHLNVGDQIPGDGLLVEGQSLVIDESSMTGESDPMSKDDDHPFMLSGCKVLDGFGTMVVTAVGMNTEWGKVMATLSEDTDESTPLQERLDSLATTIGKIGLSIAVIVFVVLLIRFLATTDLKHFTGEDGRKIVDFFAIAVTIVVVAVPEGLPLAVTLTLAYSMSKMMDDRALVRHLQACETMGSATAICSDKTGTLTMNQTKDGKPWLHWKGAAEIMLEHCTGYMQADGSVEPITEQRMEELQLIISAFANAALRTLCFAFREITEAEVESLTPEKLKAEGFPESNLTCLAIIGIKDPCRPGVPEAVAKCQSAGIIVRMVTGDNIQTAVAIATECGIYQEGGTAIEGKDFRVMTPEEQYEVLPNVQVMARASPTDKHTLVKRLLEMGEIVAVTGDGTNDAPALHEASIGLAMGIAGTEVAKEASDIIILDDNFSSIVKVVMWGRSIYVNIQKFIQFQTTVNGVALGINFVAAIVDGHAPLTAVQLLWVNLIMDTLGALALATEPPNASLMDKPPVQKSERLISNIMWRNISGQCAYQLAMLLTLHFQGLNILGLYHLKGRNPEQLTGTDKEEYEKAHEILVCMIFNAFVFCQIFNEVNARKPDKFNIFKGFFNNRLFLYVLIFTVGIQILIVEFAGVFTSTCHLRWDRWLICVALGIFSWPLAVVVKLFPVPEKPYVSYLLFWRKDEPQRLFSVNSEGDSELTSPGLSGLSSDDSEVSLPLSPYMPREAGFFTRLKYAFFPSTIPDVIVQQPRLKEPNAWA
ncbi:hypothetical protein MPTK1_4g22320 [Marchantia polymorpha subsp. ruderalis]|uniref:P-type Ca(2+) transporter n=2 Tax=Marchantia polymorpha TaxID=3197 RepID=A0AAF6BCL1_MARPO|nr:hypothetical protein MARPO_0020s0002 [Marchantia polymorpha]BBN09745.1 hypothetical protein Mp_4g22320 [Marchantia polymorpha subsp. ruderalis]|eukprot:PTQ44327.1 hypothetical protein MARPO_0020s0002 [Marchantia polymorpha]